MHDSGTFKDDPSSHPSGFRSGTGWIYALILTAIPLLYVLSPVMFAVLYRSGLHPPEEVMEVLQKFWFLLIWYGESGLPGGKEYLDFIDWLAMP